MNARALLLGLSLAVNLAGATALLWPRSSASPAAPPASVTTSPSGTATGRSSAAAPPPAPPLWTRLDSDRPEDFLRHLRAAGLPPELIKALIVGRIDDAFTGRYQALRAADTPGHYWEESRSMTHSQIRDLMALQSERDARLRELLGIDYDLSPERITTAQRRYGPIAPAKIAQLEAIDRDYESLLNSYRFNAIPTDADRAAVALLEHERATDLAALLDPSELFEYNVRRSDAARRMQYELGPFAPTEAEFRLLYPYLAQIEQDYPRGFSSAPNGRIDSGEAAARAAVATAVAAQLSPERAAELAQALKVDATLDNLYVSRLGLPLTAATRLGEIRSAYQDLIQSIVKAPAADRPAAQATAREQAMTYRDELTRLLGSEAAVNTYRDTFGGWVRGYDMLINPPPPRSPTGG